MHRVKNAPSRWLAGGAMRGLQLTRVRGVPFAGEALGFDALVYGFAWSHGKAFARISSIWSEAMSSRTSACSRPY